MRIKDDSLSDIFFKNRIPQKWCVFQCHGNSKVEYLKNCAL